MNDPKIRSKLHADLLAKYHEDPNSKVIDELRLSPARAQIDVAVLNGAFHGYEIKSAVDSLARLESQIKGYSKVFDYLSIVTEENHLSKIRDLIPEWMGIIFVSENGFNVLRESKRNSEINGFYLAQLLWKDELVELARKNNIPIKPSATKWKISEIISDIITPDKLSNQVRSILKERKNWKIQINPESQICGE